MTSLRIAIILVALSIASIIAFRSPSFHAKADSYSGSNENSLAPVAVSDSFQGLGLTHLGNLAHFEAAPPSTSSPPVAVDDYYTVHGQFDAGGPGNPPGVMANDSDPEGDHISVTRIVTPTAHGTSGLGFYVGSFSYTPAYGYVGPDSFVYELCNSHGLCSTATVRLTVVNNAPLAGDDSYTVHGPFTAGYPGESFCQMLCTGNLRRRFSEPPLVDRL